MHIAKRDSDTSAHNYRVTIFTVRLAEKLGLPKQDICSLIKGAFLHDAGKIGISDLILLKPGKLTEEVRLRDGAYAPPQPERFRRTILSFLSCIGLNLTAVFPTLTAIKVKEFFLSQPPTARAEEAFTPSRSLSWRLSKGLS